MRAPISLFLSSPSLRRAACLVLLAPALSLANGTAPTGTGSQPFPAADPDAPTAALVHLAAEPQPALAEEAPAPHAWRDAHRAVAAFPRGHADILAWEARQGAQPPASSAPAPQGAHGGRGDAPGSQGGPATPQPSPHGHHHAPGSRP
jgi:hypothetical protein